MTALVIRALAEAELADATMWYAERSLPTARRFLAMVDAALDAVGVAPERFPLIGVTIRRALVPRFPYAIYFVVSGDVISVVGVLHVRRDPRRWRGRA